MKHSHQRLKGILGILSRYVLVFNIAVTTRPLPHAAIIPIENDIRESSTHVFMNEGSFIVSKGSCESQVYQLTLARRTFALEAALRICGCAAIHTQTPRQGSLQPCTYSDSVQASKHFRIGKEGVKERKDLPRGREAQTGRSKPSQTSARWLVTKHLYPPFISNPDRYPPCWPSAEG